MESSEGNPETQKDRNFSKLFHWVVDTGLWAVMPHYAKAVLGVLERHANYTTRLTFVGNATLRTKSGLGKESVREGKRFLFMVGIMEKCWYNGRMQYKLYPTGENSSPKALEYLIALDKTQKPKRQYERNKRGRFVSSKKRKERKPVIMGENNAHNYGQKNAHDYGHINRDSLKRDFINRDFKERKEKKAKVSNETLSPLRGDLKKAFSSLSKEKDLKKKTSPKKFLSSASQETLLELLKATGSKGFKEMLLKSGYREQEIEVWLKKQSNGGKVS